MSRRTQKVEEVLRRELASVLAEGELSDPRLHVGTLAFTQVKVSPDLSLATIYVECGSSEIDADRILEGVTACAPVLRRALGRRAQLKHVPRLRFMRDVALESARRIETILDEVRAEDAARGPTADSSSEPSEG